MEVLIDRSKLIKELESNGVDIFFDLPVEEILGEDVDCEDFAMLVQDAIQAYRKMVIDIIQKMPITYDVDKVLGLLISETANSNYEYRKGIYKAIDILGDVYTKKGAENEKSSN